MHHVLQWGNEAKFLPVLHMTSSFISWASSRFREVQCALWFVPSHQYKGCCGALSLMVMRHLLTPNLTPFALKPALFISLNSSSSFLPFLLLMCLQLATVLLPSLLLAQQEEIWLRAGPLTSERCICALLLLLAKVRPGTISKKQ